MHKLLCANFSRLKREAAFWLCTVAMLAVGIFLSIKTGGALDRTFFVYAMLGGLVSSVFCGLFIGTEYGDGTMRNKLTVGHTRTAVYLSNLIVCVVAGFAFCISYIVPMLAIGIPRLGCFEMGALPVLALFGITMALSAAFSSIFTLLAMLLQNKATAAVACILCFIVLVGFAAAVNSRLAEPELIDQYAMTVDGANEFFSEPNPRYLGGPKRAVYQFLLDFQPAGQALQFSDHSLVLADTWQLPLYSLLILVLTTAAGMLAFHKKDTR